MKITRFASFTLGVLVTAVSIGTVNYVGAAGNLTIKACANKKTGAMRYISKGSCKKTEKSLNWNQAGPQGAPGPQGLPGVPGANGSSGSNGQNLFAVDATGATIGLVRGISFGRPVIEFQGRFFELQSSRYEFQDFSESSGIQFYKDSQCTQPYISAPLSYMKTSQETVIDRGTNESWDASDKAYVPVGDPLTFSGRSVYTLQLNPCSEVSSQQKNLNDQVGVLFDVEEIEKPTYQAPVTIVAR